jgi:DNA-binding MarR family transcriptional regulator
MAQELLDQMSAIRRTARRVAGNPAVLTDLTGSQLELVRIVRRRPGMSVADAAEELRLAPNTVSTLVGQLADAGIIVRTTDRDDRRVARLALDPLGSSTVVEGYDRRVEALASVLDRLSPNERRRLREAQAVLATVATLLEADATAAERASDRRHGRGRTTRRAEPGSAAHPQ